MRLISYQEVARRYNRGQYADLQNQQNHFERQKKAYKIVDYILGLGGIFSKALSVLGAAKTAVSMDGDKKKDPYVGPLPMTLLNLPAESMHFYKEQADRLALTNGNQIDASTYNLGLIRNSATGRLMGFTDGRSVVITDNTNDIGLIADGRGQRFGTVTGIRGGSINVYLNEHAVELDENGYLPGARLTDDVQIVTADDKSKIENHALGAKDLDAKGIENTGADASMNHSPSHGEIKNPTEHANHTDAKINALADMAKGLYAIPSINHQSEPNSSRRNKDGTGDDSKINPLELQDGKKPQPINIPDIQNIQILPSDSVVDILQKLIDHLEKEPEPNPPSNLLRLLFDEYTKASLRNEDPWKLVEPGDINILQKDQFADVLMNHLENMDTGDLNDFLNRINTVLNERNNPGQGFRADTLVARESDLPIPIHDNRVPSNGPNDHHQDTDPSINGEGRSDSWELRSLEEENMQAGMHDNNPQTTADMAESIHASRFGLRSQELSSNHQDIDSSESTYNKSNPWEVPKINSDSPVRDVDLENDGRDGMKAMGYDDVENIRPADWLNKQMDDKPSDYDDDIDDYDPPAMDYPE